MEEGTKEVRYQTETIMLFSIPLPSNDQRGLDRGGSMEGGNQGGTLPD